MPKHTNDGTTAVSVSRRDQQPACPSRRANGARARRLLISAALAAVGLFLSLPAHAAGKFLDPPDPNLGGGVSIKVSPVKQLEEAIVVEPTTFRAYLAKIDRASGTVSVKGIPPGKYDLVLKFDTVIVEGLRLDVPDGFSKLSEEELKGIYDVIWVSDDFFNNKTIVRMGGNGKRAKLFVDEVRDKHTVDPGGASLGHLIIRRLALIDIRKTGQIWTIKQVRHLSREERPKTKTGQVLKYLYVPKLGKLRVADDVVELPPVDLAKLKHEKLPHFYSASHRE